jgi:hypothetical protein
MKLKPIILSAVVAGSLCGLSASAQFTYNAGDLFVAFQSSGGPTNVIVDIGSASIYQNAVGSFTLTDVNSALLISTFGSLDGIYWSVFGGLNTAGSLGAADTLWVTSARPNPLTQTDPWQSRNVSGQGQVISPINGILNGTGASGANALSSTVVFVASSLNNGGAQISYTVGVGPGGDFNGAWRGDIENFTGTGFASSGTPSVSDLYQQNPGLANFGDYLGNFILGNDGSLTFDSVTPVPEPNTLAMFGAGIMSLFAFRRIRKS